MDSIVLVVFYQIVVLPLEPMVVIQPSLICHSGVILIRKTSLHQVFISTNRGIYYLENENDCKIFVLRTCWKSIESENCLQLKVAPIMIRISGMYSIYYNVCVLQDKEGYGWYVSALKFQPLVARNENCINGKQTNRMHYILFMVNVV